jgi:hypothetical protein
MFSAAHAASLEDCMRGEAERLADVKTEQVMNGQGCTTAPTWGMDDMNFSGFLAQECQADVCWKVLPNRVITNAVVASVGAAGSRTEVGEVTYVPDPARATGVCVRVAARSPTGESGATGWQKVSLTVTTRHVATAAEMIEIAASCVKRGARPRK